MLEMHVFSGKKIMIIFSQKHKIPPTTFLRWAAKVLITAGYCARTEVHTHKSDDYSVKTKLSHTTALVFLRLKR